MDHMEPEVLLIVYMSERWFSSHLYVHTSTEMKMPMYITMYFGFQGQDLTFQSILLILLFYYVLM